MSYPRKLLPTQVRAIRRALKNGDSIPTIAARWNVSRVMVSNIRAGRWYRDVKDDPAARLVLIEANLRVMQRKGVTGPRLWAALADWRECLAECGIESAVAA